jgi:hypothetical protein
MKISKCIRFGLLSIGLIVLVPVRQSQAQQITPATIQACLAQRDAEAAPCQPTLIECNDGCAQSSLVGEAFQSCVDSCVAQARDCRQTAQDDLKACESQGEQ